MACISKHGKELDRREYCDCRVTVMSDGNVIRNVGQGWKLWKKVKAGVDVAEYARSIRAKYDARPEQFHSYIETLIDACDLEHRGRLHMLADSMPEDPDGCWAMFDDFGYQLDIDDVVRVCRARQRLLDFYKSPEFAAYAAEKYPNLPIGQVEAQL